MDLWRHERLLASAHSQAGTNKLNMMQDELAKLERKANVVEKSNELALQEVGLRLPGSMY